MSLFLRNHGRLCRRVTRSLIWLCAATVFTGCSTSKLPDYAAPTVSYVSGKTDMTDVVTYRQLTRDDFRGKNPPNNYDERMAAVTCVYTQPIVDKDSMEILPLSREPGQQEYEVTYHNLRYRALMNRNCSWWNRGVIGLDEDYVLEHEQIHFALFEAAAREWSQEPPLRVRVKAQSQEEMKNEVKKQFEASMRSRLDRLREENLRFDEDTSVGRDQVRQSQWLQLVMARLQKSAEFAVTESGDDCPPDAATRAAIERARLAMRSAADPEAIEELLREAEAATKFPECDNVRAGILADKALELSAP